MKRNVKNDKVVRAITIGLAAMIAATSMPVNVYAEGEQNAPEGGRMVRIQIPRLRRPIRSQPLK